MHGTIVKDKIRNQKPVNGENFMLIIPNLFSQISVLSLLTTPVFGPLFSLYVILVLENLNTGW